MRIVTEARAAVDAAGRLLAAAEADFDAALDRGAWLAELRGLDARVVRADRAVEEAARWLHHLCAGGAPPADTHRPTG